jgi:curved DNA-binding protein CbpA
VTDDEFDAYGVLQITPNAEDYVLEAAFRALARHFHPDGATPDETRMAEINRAYDLVRTPERRKRYDRLHRRPMGPGLVPQPSSTYQAFGGRVPPPSDGPSGLRAGEADPATMTIDFGRYAGWRLKDLAKHDPDYLRWLSRHSSGVRYRNQITALLGADEAPARR